MTYAGFKAYFARLLADAGSWLLRASRDLGFAIAAASFLFWIGYALGARDVDQRIQEAIEANGHAIAKLSTDNTAQRIAAVSTITAKIEDTCGPVHFRGPQE